MTTTPIAIDELTIPASFDSPDFPAFAGMVAVRNAIETATIGTDALNVSAVDLLPGYLDQDHSPRRVFVARVAGEIVGRSVLEWSTEEGAAVAWPSVEVLPAVRGRGYGTRMLAHVEGEARRLGVTTLQHASIHTPLVGGERIPSPTGFGDVPAADPGVRFLRANGYTLEQVYRISLLDLPLDDTLLARRESAALGEAGPDYRVVRWVGPTPERWLDDMAVLRNRMSVDAPSAGLDVVEETWDADRVRASEELGAISGRLVLTVAVEHGPSGRLAGFSQLFVPSESGSPASQEDTLVLREHRGHRLGMVLKIANLHYLAKESPETTLVTTFNAEENRHMLDVNEAVGFRPAGLEGNWRKAIPF